ncbi:MAG: glycosyltransferase family 4 protein [Promethearchaeota archaeon]
MTDDIRDRYKVLNPIALSNPWFGVGGLERVYLAITSAKPDSSIIVVKNYHDNNSFHYYFGNHRSFPRVFDGGIAIEGDSPHVHLCMCHVLNKYFRQHDTIHSAHVTNHWGLFFQENMKAKRNIIYFQPGVWEIEAISRDPVLSRMYQEALEDHKILVNSKYMQRLVKESFDHDSSVLYPCTDTEFFSAGQHWNDSPDSAHHANIEKIYDIMIFSRLNPGKKFDNAINMLARIHEAWKDAKFLISGAIRKEESSYLDTLKHIAREKGLYDLVTFQPNPSAETLKLLYQKTKLMLFLPKNEPLGLVPVEAIVSGVPVIGFASGGISETVIDGKTGILCKDEDDMVDSTVKLLNDESRIDALRKNSSIVEKKYSERNFLENFITFIEDC